MTQTDYANLSELERKIMLRTARETYAEEVEKRETARLAEDSANARIRELAEVRTNAKIEQADAQNNIEQSLRIINTLEQSLRPKPTNIVAAAE